MNDAGACARSEMLAGAIALGEATEAERDAYRRHLAACGRCVDLFGGEREIERVMGTVAAARDTEVWQADVTPALARRPADRRRIVLATGGAAAVAALVALGVRVAVPGQAGAGLPPAHPVATVAQRPAPQVHRMAVAAAFAARAAAQADATKLVVVHNVVTLRHAQPAADNAVASAPQRPAARRRTSPAAQLPAHSETRTQTLPGPAEKRETIAAIAPTERDQRSLSALRTAERPPAARQQAESIAVVPQPAVIRDAVPIGGDGAIVPNPPAIAYSENAEGTTAVEVTVDERGVPTKCTITKASGYVVLDEAVCRAAMRARFFPRTINGRAVVGVYRDAFTFRSTDDR